MAGDFLPEYSYLPVSGFYRPTFRLFEGSGWKYVRRDGIPIECATAGEAIEAAKECVKRILNPTIRAEQAAVAEDVLGVDNWYRERAGQAARDQMEAMGSLIVRGRQIKVETRKARA